MSNRKLGAPAGFFYKSNDNAGSKLDHSLLQIGPFVPVPKTYLSRFWNRDSAAGKKGLLSRVVEPGQNVPRAKKYLRPAGLEPKTYCLAHGFLANSTK